MNVDDLINLRKRMKLSQGGLAGKLGMSTRAWQDIENGRAELRPIHILAIKFIALECVAMGADWSLMPSDVITLVSQAAEEIPEDLRQRLADT